MIIGLGTIINVLTILVGTSLGVLIGHRLSEKTSRVVTDGLGLVVLVLGGLNVVALADQELVGAVGVGIPLLIVIGAILIGGIAGSALKIEQRLEQFGGYLQKRFAGKGSKDAKEKFITGFVNASLVFTIGPLAILGALSDGLGQGIERLATKSILDGFASLAFAASLGWGGCAIGNPGWNLARATDSFGCCNGFGYGSTSYFSPHRYRWGAATRGRT